MANKVTSRDSNNLTQMFLLIRLFQSDLPQFPVLVQSISLVYQLRWVRLFVESQSTLKEYKNELHFIATKTENGRPKIPTPEMLGFVHGILRMTAICYVSSYLHRIFLFLWLSMPKNRS